MLEESGYLVVKANGPAAAELRLRQHPDVDLVVLDCILPCEEFDEVETQQGTLTGYLLYKKYIEKLEIPVILWSGLAQAFALGWGKNVILKARKQMHESELLDLVERSESLLTDRRRK